MYAYFKGIVQEMNDDQIVLEVNNIGYNIFVPASVFDTIREIGQEVKIYTYTSVREDAFILFGFTAKEDLEMFKKLITVSGIGPKGALGILSTLTTDTIKFAVMAGDAKLIATAPGIGKKTAEKMIIELKDKLGVELPLVSMEKEIQAKKEEAINPAKQEAIDAMSALGFSATDASKAIGKIEITTDMDAGEILRLALRAV